MKSALAAGLAIVLVSALAAPAARAQSAEPQPVQAKERLELEETAIRFEINDTDGDAGIQIFLDGEGWNSMRVFDPDQTKLLVFKAESSIGVQGITELFFESAEPSFDEQPLSELLALFPEGEYRFNGRTTEGTKLVGRATLTHALPAAPQIILPVEGDDEVDPDDTVVEWAPVADPPGSEIVGYQVIVAREEPSLRVLSADVGPDVASLTVPPEFLEPGTEYKLEVLSIEASGNQTISEGEFATAGGVGDDDDDDDEG